MEKVLFLILVATHTLCYEAIEFQEIRPLAPRYHLRAQNLRGKFSILNSRPLHIVFEDFNATTVRCWAHHKYIDVRHDDIFLSNGTTTITIDEITSDMSAKWSCNLTDINNSKTVFKFEIRIKAAKMVPVYIDKMPLQYTLTNETVSEYDGFNEYLCEEGVTINLECQNPFTDGSLILRYYNADGSNVIGTDYIDKAKDLEDKQLSFRVLMSSKANGSYVECTYLTAAKHEQNQQEFTYRIFFLISKDPVKNDYFSITINDMKLQSNLKKGNGRDIYNYDFIYGEDLVITCEKKDKNILADIKMGTLSSTMRDFTHMYTKDPEITQSVYKLFVKTTYLHETIIEFSLFDSDSNEYLRASINFYVESFGGPAIVGLPANNILYQYSKNKNEWVSHYQYTPNEKHLLTCITRENKTLRWFQGNKLGAMTKGQDNKVGIKYIRDMFTLNENKITCQLADETQKTWTLIFHRKPDLPPMKPHENLPDNVPYVSQKLLVIIGSTVGVLLVIIITAMSLFYWYRRHRVMKQKEPTMKFSGTDNPISDIVNQNNGEYTYITNEYNYIKSDDSATTTNSLYCRYMSNNMNCNRDTTYSGQTENHYTEIEDYFRRNTENPTPTNKVCNENNKSDYETSTSGPTYNNV